MNKKLKERKKENEKLDRETQKRRDIDRQRRVEGNGERTKEKNSDK